MEIVPMVGVFAITEAIILREYAVLHLPGEL